MDFSRFKTFIFDLDGTIWNWSRLFPGVKKTVNGLKKNGKLVLFITNNSFCSRAGLVRRLRRLGLDVNEKEVIASSSVAADYLKRRNATAFAIGKGVGDELKRASVKLTDKNPEYLVVGHDQEFNMRKLAKAYKLLQGETKLLAVAAGRVWYVGKKLYPATGAILAAIEFVSGKNAILVGKPFEEMIKTVKANVHSKKEETVIFGDECGADISMGKKLGYFTVLVRTGIDRACILQPDAVIDSIADIEI